MHNASLHLCMQVYRGVGELALRDFLFDFKIQSEALEWTSWAIYTEFPYRYFSLTLSYKEQYPKHQEHPAICSSSWLIPDQKVLGKRQFPML